MTELLANYAKYLTARGLRSGKLYEQAARRFLFWLSAKNLVLSQVTPGLLHEYLCHRRSPEHRPATLRAVVNRLRGFFRYAVSEKLAVDDPTQGVSERWLDIPGGFPGYQGVLRRIFRKPSDIVRFRFPLFAPHWESYLALLLEQGYSKNSFYHVIEHSSHFHSYLAEQGIRSLNKVSPRILESFLRHRQRKFRQVHRRPMPEDYCQLIRSCLKGLLAHVGQQHRRTASKSRAINDTAVFPDSLLHAYLDFCRDHSGLKPATMLGYHRELLRLRSFMRRRGICSARKITPADLDAFLMRRSKSMNPRAMQSVTTALRSFLRYLYLNGHIHRDLAASVVSPSRYRADLRPKYLPWRRIEELLASVDRTTPTGKRDYAILVLLACHGLRAREAATLKVSDVDLGKRCLHLRHRKNGTVADIPISPRTTEALRDCLAEKRDNADGGLFLTAHAPIKPLSGSGISAVAQRYLRKSFGGRGGAYALRHSFAKALLDRGARLHDIGALLGHKSLRSTLIYTRIATEDMREVADNYAGWL